MPCQQCGDGAWECGWEDLCMAFDTESGDTNPWEEVGDYHGPTPVKVFVRKHKGRCHVRFEPI